MSAGRRRASRPKRPVLRAVLASAGALVGLAVIIAAVAAGYVGHLASTYDRESTTIPEAFPTGDRPAPDSSGALNVLLIGSDSRSSLNPDGDHAGGGRSDTLMLAHISADRRSVSLMSIMRDSWVPIPGHGTAKINAAYSWGGVPLTVQTVEQLLDVHVDHVAEIDFLGFRDMTNALGGVDVDSTKAFLARGHQIHEGVNHLDGDTALAFVRERYAFPDADYQRVKNQQAFIRGLVDGVVSKGTLTDPGTISSFVGATSKYLSVDETLTFQRLAAIGWSLRHIAPSDLQTFTMPTAGGASSVDGQSYVAVNEVELASLKSALRGDAMTSWLDEHGH
jgi:LCP family protein required for cell wall assembly